MATDLNPTLIFAVLMLLGAVAFLTACIMRYANGPRKFMRLVRKYRLTGLSTAQLNTRLREIADGDTVRDGDRNLAKKFVKENPIEKI